MYPVSDGGPTVVYLPGAGLVGLDFLNLASPGATHVFYDRGATGWSSPVPLPRSAADVARELRDTLTAASLPPPYTLVGHSMGAVYAPFRPAVPRRRRRDAAARSRPRGPLRASAAGGGGAQRPYETGPGAAARLTPAQVEAAREAYGALFAAWPAEVRAELTDHHLAHWRTGLHESANLESAVYDELRHGGPVPDVPVIVLTAGAGNPAWSAYGPPSLVAETLAGIRALHAKIAASFTRGEQRVIDGATHQYAHIEQPDAVRAALRDLLSLT